jgi:hypothetical protein
MLQMLEKQVSYWKGKENIVWQPMLEIFKVFGENKHNLENLNMKIKMGIPGGG